MRPRAGHRLRALAALAAAAGSFPGCGDAAQPPAGRTATRAIVAMPFGRQGDNPVHIHTLTNSNGLVARISN